MFNMFYKKYIANRTKIYPCIVLIQGQHHGYSTLYFTLATSSAGYLGMAPFWVQTYADTSTAMR